MTDIAVEYKKDFMEDITFSSDIPMVPELAPDNTDTKDIKLEDLLNTPAAETAERLRLPVEQVEIVIADIRAKIAEQEASGIDYEAILNNDVDLDY